MKCLGIKLTALCLALVMMLALPGCGGKSSGSEEKEPVYSFVNTLMEPAINESEKLVAPVLVEEIQKKASEVNKEIVGWLQVPGTDINQPVVQSYNNTKYMRLDYAGKYNFQGCYWVDYECKVGARAALSRNTIIYGHNTSITQDDLNGLDFAQLLRYTDEDFAKKHPYIFFSSAQEDMVWEIFAAFYTDTNFRYIDMINKNISTLISEARSRSEFTYKIDLDENADKVLTLSTCTAKYGYVGGEARGRFVVMARLVPAGTELKETVDLEKNPSVKAPQL